jgi:hypothetical protein
LFKYNINNFFFSFINRNIISIYDCFLKLYIKYESLVTFRYLVNYFKIYKLYKLLYVVLVLILYTIIVIFYNYIIYIYFIKYFYNLVILSMLLYLITSTVLFLNKFNLYGKYTTSISRFWKRSYILIWLVEFFIFLLVFTLLFIHYKESIYFLDLRDLLELYYDFSYFFVLQCFFVSLIIIFNYFILMGLRYKHDSATDLYFILINILFLILLYIELSKFMYIVNYCSMSVNINILQKFNIFNIESNTVDIFLKTRMLNYYIFLFSILKFWHIFFIYMYYMFILYRYTSDNGISYDLVSCNMQNFIYIYIFNIFLFMFYVKYVIFYFFSEYFYYFFFNFSESFSILLYDFLTFLTYINL